LALSYCKYFKWEGLAHQLIHWKFYLGDSVDVVLRGSRQEVEPVAEPVAEPVTEPIKTKLFFDFQLLNQLRPSYFLTSGWTNEEQAIFWLPVAEPVAEPIKTKLFFDFQWLNQWLNQLKPSYFLISTGWTSCWTN
jgi:hypothetical protein